MLNVTSTPVELIDDDTATTYYNDLDTLEGAERDSRADALRLWAEQKKSDQKREQFDTLNKIYSDFDGYVNEAGLQDFDEDSRYRIANRQFIASQFEQTPEEQQETYPSFRDKWTESVAGKNGMSEKETFGLIKQGIDARNEVSEAANQIPGDIALSLFDSIGGGDPVDVPKLIETWKTKNAESIKKLPKGWETPLLESAQAFHTETEGMLRDYAEPLKKVYDHFSAVTGRDTERAGETNPKNEEEMNSMVDTLASMPKPVRERAYASVVLGAKKAGQDPKTFMEQWGESWSRTLNMVRTGALTAQEMAAESDLRMLENKETPPDYFISKSTGEKIPLANRAFHDEADLRKVTPEEIAADAGKARQKVKRFEIIRELKNVADNQFDPIEKINKGGFLGFMESMAYGSPQGLAYTATALVPFVGPYLAGAAIFSDEYDQLRSQGMNVDQAIQVGSVSAAIQAGLERTGAKALFGKLPVFEKLMRKIGNPARVGKAGSAGVRFLAAATGEQLVEGAQDLTTPLVQDVAEALGADVPEVKWQPILEKWEGSRLDVLAASLPTIFFGTGVASFADNKRFAQFEERQDIYRMTGMDDAAIKKIEDGKNLAEVQQNFQTEFGKLTPENVKAGVAYIEGKITSAQEQQQDSNTHTLTRETLADGSKKFVIRDPKGEVKYTTEDAQSAQIAISELLRNQITGTTRGIFESISFFNQMNEVAGRGEDVQKFLLSDAPRNLLTDYEANPTEQNLDNLFKTVRAFGQDISEPAELANFPVLASNQGALAEGIFKSVIQIHEGATGDKVVRDVAQDNLKRAIAEQRITMEWVRENLNQIIPQIDSKRITGYRLRTETDTDVIESFSDVALAYMVGDVREEQIPEGFRGFLRRMAIIVKDIYRRAYNLKRLVAEGKVDANFETLLADSVGLNQQARVDTASQRIASDVLADTDGKVVFSRAQAQTNAGEIRASNATITGPANYSIAAHHGTPHKVDKFSTAKIGTGEGAQAYGWGLYFAEEKKVATGYRDALSGVKLLDAKGEVLVGLTSNPVTQKILKEAQYFWKNGETTLPSIISEITQKKRQAEVWASSGSNVQSNTEFVSGSEEAIRLLQGGSSAKVDGNLYTAEIDVEPEDLLDWDKPISEQSPKVQAALQSVSDNWLWQDAISGKGGERVGGALYSTLRATFPDAEFSRDGVDASKKASEALLAAGIPGIRYLDGSSRSEGQGTYNYVAFDENLIRITEENGNRIPASQALTSGQANYSIGSMPEDQRAAEQSGQPSRGGLSAEESFGRPSEEFVESDVKKTYWNINSEGGSISLYKETPWDEDSDSATGESKYSVFYSEALESDSQDEYRFSNPADAKEKIDSILREETQAAEYGKWVESTIDSFRGTFDFKKSNFFTSAEVKPIGWSSKSSSRYFSVNLDIKPELAETFDSKNIGDYEDGTLNLRVRFADHAEKSGPSNDISIETRDYHSQQFSRQDSKTAESQMAAAIADGVLWKKIAEIYNDPELDFSRPAPATGATNYSIGKKNSLRVKMTRTALTDAALNQASWKDWYEEHQSTLDEFFGDHAQLFQDILSVTSQAASVKANVGLALKAFGQMHRGEEFKGFLPAVIKNLSRLRENTQVQGQKISAYKNSNDGKVDEAVIDRHIARLIFGVDSPSKAQFAKAQKILTEIANEIGWTPRQVQAALWAHSIYKSGKTPQSYGDYLKKLESRGTLAKRIGDIGSRGGTSNADGRGRGRFAPESTADGAGLTNYSIRSVEHFKNDKRFDKLVKDGRVVIGHDIEEFKGMHILLHSPDNAFAGTIKLTDGEEIQGKGGVYYPALFADKNYFWASTEAMVMRSANHLNKIGEKNGGKILMALVSAPVEKLFSSTSMSTGVVKFLNALTSDSKAGLSKEKLNSMLVAASKVEVVKQTKSKGPSKKAFSFKLKGSDGLQVNLTKIGTLLDPTGSIFEVRKMFVESLAEQLSEHLGPNLKASEYVAGILADAENKHAKSAIKRGKLSKASILQGLGNLLTEPFLRDFQDHGNGKIYAVLEVNGIVDGVASSAHDSYPFTLVPRNKKSKVKLHVLNQSVDWQDVVGKDTGEYTTPEERMFLMPTSGMSATSLKVLGVRGGSKSNPLNYSIASQSEIDRVNKALGGMNRGPDERLKVYQRAKNSFSRVMQENKEALDAIRSSVSTDTAPATERVEMDRAGKMADVSSEEKTELEKALQDNADTFLPRIEAAQTPAERKKVERDAKDRAKILEQGIRDKFAERKKSVDAEAKSQRDQIVQAAAAKDSASNARMRDKVRLTKLVNAIGELDGILKALPPEVRGRVGGFAVLANIGTGDKALADFFVQRIDMIDRQLERTLKEEYGTQFDALLERTKPKKAKAGEKPKGIGADIQSLFSAVREARGWNPDKVDGHIADIETQIAAGNLTPEEEAWLTREADLVSLAGDWKNADSSRRAAALEASTETWAKGMYEFVQKKIQEREARDIARAKAIKATGKKGDYPDRRARSEADNGLKGKSHGWLMDTMSWDQVAGIVFGHESPIAIELSDGQRKAEYTKIDAVQAKEDAIHDLFTQLAGGSRLEGEKLMWKMSQPSIDAGGLNLSQLEALSPTMLWAQEDGRRHMIGQLDETGNPTSRWHYNQQFIDDIESQLSPEAKAVRDFLWDSYGKGWFSINSVYRDLNGISLPRIFKYSPVTVNPINVPSGMVSDPVTGNAVSAGSISPGALRTRGTAIAQPNFRNVISTYIAHTRQMEHWKAFAPWTKEANGILRNRDVQDSIHEAGGEEANKVLNRFLDAFAQGGNRDASLGLEISQTLSRMTSRAAQVALVGRVGTLAIQFTQIGAASAELPMGAYVSRLGKLMTGNLSWAEALNSPYIQRRLKQMPPTVQIAMEGLKAGKPNQLKHQVTKVGQLISGSDALWTAGTYAMVYDYHLGQAKSFGYTGQAAEEYAHNTAERVTDRLAQPTRMGTRSIYEITSTNPGAKLGFAFASEARKNIALLAYTKANRSKGQFGTAALGFVLFNLAMGAFIRNAWKDMKDDDDEELFDDKTWNWKRIGVAMLTEPLQGIPYLGDYIEKGINAALGQYHQSSDLINFERGVRAIKHIPDIIDGERDMEGVLKDIDGMVSLMGMFNQSAAAAAALTHIASDFFGVAKNATTED